MAVTINDIAKELGVAPSTVSNVLANRNKGSYPKAVARAEKIRALAKKRGYRPNAAARAIRARRTYQIGVLLPNRRSDRHTHPAAFESVLGLNEGLQSAGYVVSIIRFDDVEQSLVAGARVFREQMLDGLIVSGSLPEWAEAEAQRLVPRVLWMDANIWWDTNCIRRDEETAGRETVARMAGLGYRRMVWLGYPTNPPRQHYSHAERRRAAFAAAEEAGQVLDVVELEAEASPAWSAVLPHLSPDTVVVAESHYHAQVLAHYAGHNGLSVPGDFGLACCDASHEVDRLWPGLCRMSFDRIEMGLQASEMIQGMIERKDHAVPSRRLSGRWIEGNTACGSAGGADVGP